MFILNIVGAIAVGMGMYELYDSIIVAILVVIILNGAPQIWFLHNIWYVVFEFFKIGKLSVYGYVALAVWIIILAISIFTSQSKKNRI